MRQPGRQEGHVCAVPAQHPQQVELAQRGRIPIRGGYGFVDEQDRALLRVQQGRAGYGAGRWLPAQRMRPLVGEYLAVARLVGLHPAAGVGAGGGALVVQHTAGRLVAHPGAECTYREGQVGVLVVGRCVARVEAAGPGEQGAWNRQRRAGAVVGLAHIGVARIVGGLEAAVAPGAAVGEHHPAGLLQASVRIQQLRHRHAGVGLGIEGRQQCVQPARLRQRVVVEEHQEPAPGLRGTVVAGGDEAAVGGAAVIAQAVHLRHPGGGVVAAAIVDHDHLAGRRRRMRGQGPQAGQGGLAVVVDRDDDAGPRGRAGHRRRQRQRRERQRGRPVQRDRWRWRRAQLQPGPLPGGAPAAAAQARQPAAQQAAQVRQPVAGHGQPVAAARRGLHPGGNSD